MAAKTKEKKKTFSDEVSELLKRLPVSREEKGKLGGKIEELAEKHFK
jgi:hypothetical protein